ncbi:pentatricopeptide repeat-containing protein At4g35130, chloroplastic-like [Phoenix dactylifera]|uniref:Pentatricopeptide repeat-containing protein At4g35130, chloroplastic-like n=1 Tax=Phoenix dactylifera TaxID=42345 RepID=A0A8B9AIA8_PHODC|nr:pentatricopeptide repeat-containing protein At4g35130, chloroplastic-like [Phoenix dactylifera]
MLHRCKEYLQVQVLTLHRGFRSISRAQNRIFLTAGFRGLTDTISEFKALSKPDAFHWNAIIKAHVDAGLFDAALSLFSAMREAGARPDHYTFPLVNRAISSWTEHFKLGEAIHCLGIQTGFGSDIYFCNTMIEVYARSDFIGLARRLFDEMLVRDVVSWTSMISGYVEIGDTQEPLRLFHEMQREGLEPSSVTLAVILRACGVVEDVVGGSQLFSFVIKKGFESHELVQNSLLMVFSKAGCFKEMKELFSRIQMKSVVSWNIIMSANYSMGDVSQVVHCYEKMKTELIPSHETLTLVISAFAKCGDLHQGQKVHCYAVKCGQIDAVLEASLVDFYAKCGELALAIQLFEEIEVKTSTSWSVMMWDFIQQGQFRDAIDLFQRMQSAGFEPSADVIRGLVLSYTHLGALRLGKGIHGYLIRNKLGMDSDDKNLETSILNMYVKCGSIILAQRCFDLMVLKDTVAWSSMIEGYAIHGLGSEALRSFHQMQEEGITPNGVTFLSLLSACSHSGLVSEGRKVFDCMTRNYGIKPDLNHYTCMVDLLGRSEKLHEALEVINSMDAEPDGRIWGALLASCRTYSDGRLGNYAAQKIFDLEPDNVGYHVVLSNIHASTGKWDVTENIRKFMGEKGFIRRPGWSCIEDKGGLQMFVAGDRSHPQAAEIYEVLGCLTRHIEEIHAFETSRND